jgi:hypothetical protein
MTPTPTETPEKLRREIATFFIVLGLLLGVAAYFALTGISRHARPLWGYPRHQAIGVPLAVLAALHFLPGILMLIFPSRLLCVAGALASTLIAAIYVAFMYSATGTFPISLITFVILAIPMVVWSRVAKFMRLYRNE